MSRLLAGLLLTLLGGGAVAQPPLEIVLNKGAEIKLLMAETLTSKHAYIGQRVELQVAEDVVVGDALLIPKGTRVLGTVQVGKEKEGKKNNPHNVAIQIDYIRLGERRIGLSGAFSDKGKVDSGKVVAGAMLLGLSGALIGMDSRTGEIREGQEVKALVAEDVALPALHRISAPEKPVPHQ